ncbi:hypothetical protein M406DRAFT_335816 [Cryphonectria parasitica EP155]|uniref:Anaphase-promoting complex subunit 4 n=1 Tax=Cryphonectria parasitica (strain ATCC 38755 / EP155) TaxID=660469 RepID=A0A9P5CT86_CRYP1|nr:uncharacterized protein M406DRAFT_335816 [Cryphonectria parasitica EP155]KAF3770073.1 hypothetical protein M406DRAFT_335816 [Cryphonectria parasitica EP155]
MPADEEFELKGLSQTTFPAHVSSGLLAPSPTPGLVATVANGNNLEIRRDQGELVSSNTERGRAVQALCWKADGQFLAAGWDDGTVRLLSVENTKVVHRLNVAQRHADNAEPAQIVHIAWVRNLARERRRGRGRGPKAHITSEMKALGSEIGGSLDAKNDGHIVDLPHALTFFEIDASLPKISPLPVSGGTGDDMFAFSTATALESMFPPLKLKDSRVVDVMVVGTKDGHVHLSIYDSFFIGSFYVPIAVRLGGVEPRVNVDGTHEVVLHASHPKVSTHCLIMGPTDDGVGATTLYVVLMDLRFISDSPFDLSLLASKTTMLQKLLRYLKQAQIHILNEWQATRELPSRFLNFIQQDLQKMDCRPNNIVQALYHTVLTGHVHAPVKDWLVESIGDRGHKRWEKAVIPSLESLCNLIHENTLPALERITLILSRLSGIARFHEQDDHIGFTSTDITRLVNIVAALHFVCNKILLLVIEELDLFRVFSSWLRITIDRVSTSNVSDEIMEKEALLDTSKVLQYIEGYLVSSPLALYFEKLPKEIWEEDRASIQDWSKVLDQVDQELKQEEAGKPFKKALPQLGFLVDLLTERTGGVLKNIAEAERRSVRFGAAAKFELQHGGGNRETFKLFDGRMRQNPRLVIVPFGAGTPSACLEKVFPGNLAEFVPRQMKVQEANDYHGQVPHRVCLLGKDEVSYKVFTLIPEREELVEHAASSSHGEMT